VADVLRILEQRGVHLCVASQAPPARTKLALQLTKLLHFFGSNVFTSFDVSRGKPHPDLFLYAAARLGVDPSRCVVIEDSPSGAEAATAAGMRVFVYAAGEEASELLCAGATVFREMSELPGLLEDECDA
jgi:HAD superfamily hydrolase (TIGR01509 family)